MNLWKRIFGVGAVKEPDRIRLGESLPLGMQVSALPTAVYPSTSFLNLVNTGFKKNELVYRAITLIASSFAAAPLRVYNKKTDEENPTHPMLDLFANPNPWTSQYALWETTIIHLMVAGNWYCYELQTNAGKLVQLIPLRPDMVKVLVGDKGLIGYEYQYGAVRHLFSPEEILHIKITDPMNQFIGMSPLQTALRQIALDNEGTDMVKSLLQNSGIPGVVVETEQELNPDQIKAAEARWVIKFGGSNRGKVGFLNKGMKVQKIGLDLQQLDLSSVRGTSETRILSALGVPPIMVGAKAGLDKATYANYEEARISFYDDTIEPLQNRVDDDINRHLLSEYDNLHEARFDNSQLSAYSTRRNQQWQNSHTAFIAGWITRNEARTRAGLPADATGDVYLQPFTSVEAPQVIAKMGKSCKDAGSPTGYKSSPVGLISRAIARRTMAERWLETIKVTAAAEFKTEGEEVLALLKSRKTLGNDQLNLFNQSGLQQQWRDRIYKWAMPLLTTILGEAAESAAADLSLDYSLSSGKIQEFIQGYLFKFADKTSSTAADEVRQIMLNAAQGEYETTDDLFDALRDKFTSWGDIRADMVARTETIRASNAGAKEAWRDAGIQRTEWLEAGDACELCQMTAGEVRGINEQYYPLDTELTTADGLKMTCSYEAIEYPPLHPNCRCCLIPVIE